MSQQRVVWLVWCKYGGEPFAAFEDSEQAASYAADCSLPGKECWVTSIVVR